METVDGRQKTVQLDYKREREWDWAPSPLYPGFELVRAGRSFDIYLYNGNRPILLLSWKNFGLHLRQELDQLMVLAQSRNWLDHQLIVDATESDGGQAAVYALQRLSGKPFKVTFGDVKFSDISEALFAGKEDQAQLHSWWREDLKAQIKEGQKYSKPVPFKLQFLPKDSDGVIQPSPVHFKGKMVVLTGPKAGSQVDQFAAMLKDNGLATLIGMPTGGYSNTWEWEELLSYPGTQQALVRFMWSVGNTLRPNGQILEGNSVEPNVLIPLSQHNFLEYKTLLLREALNYLKRS